MSQHMIEILPVGTHTADTTGPPPTPQETAIVVEPIEAHLDLTVPILDILTNPGL